MPQIVDEFVLVLGSDGQPDRPTELCFTIWGSPLAQNGWKLAWKGRTRPTVYDAFQVKKSQLRASIRSALTDLSHSVFPVFWDCTIRIRLTFHLHNANEKDLDNMMKYVFDAMQEVLYINDSLIMVAEVQKKQTLYGDPECTTVDILRLDN